MQVSWSVHDEWREWLVSEQLPAIIASGCFDRFQLVRLKEINEEEGATYAVQLYSSDEVLLNKFRDEHLRIFQQQEKKLWGDSLLSFASVMEVIN